MTRPTRACGVVAAIAVMSLGAACGGDDAGGGGGEDGGADSAFSVTRVLSEIPAPSDRPDLISVNVTDLDRATEIAGLERPAPDATDIDDLWPWLRPLTLPSDDDGDVQATVLLPSFVLPNQQLQQHDEMVDELGFGIGQVSWLVEYGVPPEQFLVLGTDEEPDDLTAAMTTAMGEPEDGVWALGPADGEISPADRTAARPLGESLRFAVDDGRIAAGRTTPPVRDWIDGDAPTLADDADLAAVSTALDEAGVYTAILLAGNREAADFDGPAAGPAYPLGEFQAIGVGLTVDDDGEAVVALVYEHADAAGAEANRAELEALLETGTSYVSVPYEESFDVIGIEVDGTLVIARLGFEDFPLRGLWNLVFAGDPLTVHG